MRSQYLRLSPLLTLSQLVCCILADASGAATHSPTVTLSNATVIGTKNGSLDKFFGIRYAEPPVGRLRLNLPSPITAYNGTVNATVFGNQCIQQSLDITQDLPGDLLNDVLLYASASAPNTDVPQDEDCLFVNVIRPAQDVLAGNASLPVLVYIHGGAFAHESSTMTVYDGSPIVQKSIDMGEPIIYVSFDYRLNVFGFLGGREIKEAGIGNLGLHDQRAALRWVNKFISAFGGDATKVTIWGESAGSISVALHLFANDGDTEGLFRAAIMSSGSLPPTGDITTGQSTFDFVVEQAGCSNAPDTLECLRGVPAERLAAAADKTPNYLGYAGAATPFEPRADGIFVTMPPQLLPFHGTIADVPFIIGDVKDEGTLLSIGSTNITTDREFLAYINTHWFPSATHLHLAPLLALYPSDPAAGSPFDTGRANAFTPQFKRIAALQGDWFFQAPRRMLLDNFSHSRTIYDFMDARESLPGLGVAHGSDLLNAFGPGDMTEYFVRFVRNLDPNPKTRTGKSTYWPPYNTWTRSTLQFNSGSPPVNITKDVERLAGTTALSALSLRFPL